ncbi:phage portal protein [Weissella tructae]|uniref:phage portal protein n=1 Tax=Weissella tructae TaxID=887702 RepID=UPI001BDD8C4E|nr:phage portal protein [Weissella tructae]QVV90831.1 phage portal protein [Weissella tructae]
MQDLLSDDLKIVASALKSAIDKDTSSDKKDKARQGIAYYNYKHDILDGRIMYYDDNGMLVEDKYASNIKIPHGFLTELIDQKTQFLLSNPVEAAAEDDELQELINEYYDEEFNVFLQDLVENGSQKGFEYAYVRTTSDDRIKFQVADGLKVMPVYDEGGDIKRVLRYYDREVVIDNETTQVHFAELYDAEKVWYFKAIKTEEFTLDPERTPNPAPHIMAVTDDDQQLTRNYGTIPFFRYQNNQQEITDLEPVKPIIDDYDLMNASLSNNLQDFQDAIYVVTSYDGDLSEMRQNIKSRKAIGVFDGGGVDIKTVDIPIEARRTKLEMDKENVYKFGFGFDSSQVGDGNVTNVVIKGRYTLLNMKANKTEARLRAFLRWANELVIADINRLHNMKYNPKDVTFTITREMLVNENDLVANEKVEAETRNLEMETLLAIAPHLPDSEVLHKICEAYELDFDEVSQNLDLEAYTGLGGDADVEED